MISFRKRSLDSILKTFTTTKTQLEEFVDRTEKLANKRKTLADVLRKEADDLEAEAIKAESIKKNIIKIIG